MIQAILDKLGVAFFNANKWGVLMSKGRTGASTSKIVNTNKVRSIKCDCRLCFHSERITVKSTKKSYRYCRYYDLIKPNKSKCARYYKAR